MRKHFFAAWAVDDGMTTAWTDELAARRAEQACGAAVVEASEADTDMLWHIGVVAHPRRQPDLACPAPEPQPKFQGFRHRHFCGLNVRDRWHLRRSLVSFGEHLRKCGRRDDRPRR